MGKKRRIYFSVLLISIVILNGCFFYIHNNNETNRVANYSIQNKEVSKIDKSKANEVRNIKQDFSYGKNRWQLIWQDEFDDVGIDLNKWNVEDWAANKNNELQYYSPNNVKVEGGLLSLISKKENYGGKNYTSGAIHTKGKFSFLYGKVEMRAKLPKGQGIFPAFWMMTNKDNTWLPEIDILEMLGHRPDEIWMVIHRLNDNGKLSSQSNNHKGEDYSKGFHTYGIEWFPHSITWFIDGVERFKVDQHIPDEDMYLYLNTAIGGYWPGSPDQTTPFPAFYKVDYIRVYKRIGG